MKYLLYCFSMMILSLCTFCTEHGAVSGTKSKDSCEIFVTKFPSSFSEFNSLYGYDDKLGKAPLYDNYEQHIAMFFNCEQAPLTRKLEKVVKIGMGGKWEADAVGLFQNETMKLIKANPDATIKVLNNYPENEMAGFWRFVFDGPHPGDKINRDNASYLIERFGADQQQSKIVRTEFEKLVSAQDH